MLFCSINKFIELLATPNIIPTYFFQLQINNLQSSISVIYKKQMSHRIKRSIRLKTQKYEQKSVNLNSPFQSSLSAILIDKCDKCTFQLQKDNLKVAGELLASIDKDLPLLHPSHIDYARLMSLIYNAKAGFHRKIGQNQQALKYIQQAICIQKSGNVDRIDMARTLLNKSVLMGQMARQDKNLYSHQSAISLAKQALQIIKNRPQGKQFVHKDQYKLGQIIIISFHNIATELICLKNQRQGYNLYKKAYDLALRVLGPRHNLTIHLKNILNRYKQQKKQSKRIMTQQDSQSPSRSNLMVNSQMNKSVKKTNFIAENKKFKNFFKIYGYSKDHSVYQTTKGPEQVQMKDLTKLQKMYKPSGTHSYFPELKRKNIREIINQGRTQGQKRPLILSVGERVRQNQNQKQRLSKFNSSKENSGKRLQKLKTEQIVITSPTQKLLDSKLGLQESKISKNQAQQETNPKVQEGGCQLI